MEQANILLVGATGTVGSALCKQLSSKGVKYRCMVRDPNTAGHLQAFEKELVLGDLGLPKTLTNALRGIEKVFLCTPLHPSQVELQGNLAWACKQAQVKHLVKISTLGSHPNSPNLFAKWHGLTEQRIRDLEIPFTFLRPHYFMQNTLMFQPSMQSSNSIFTPMNDARISLVDSDDVAAVACSVLTSPGHENQTYEITGPEALSFHDVARVFSDFYKRPIEHLTMPYDLTEVSMREYGAPEWLIEGTISLYKFFDTGDAAFVRGSVLDIAQKKPTSLRTFVERYADYFRS